MTRPGICENLVVPASRDGLGPFYRDVIAVSPLEPWDAASAAYRLEILARTLPVPVGGARLVPSNNNDVWRLETGYLRVAWRGDRSRLAREAELLGRLRGSLPVPEVLDCGGEIIFWPPDRAEADDLEVTHPLHTLRRLIDTPLPLLGAGLSWRNP